MGRTRRGIDQEKSDRPEVGARYLEDSSLGETETDTYPVGNATANSPGDRNRALLYGFGAVTR